MTGERIIAGRYQLADLIGTGAMGVVWRATDQALGRTVAVKQLLLASGLTPAAELEAKRRAMREGRIAARLHHPNAVTIFDVVEEDGQPWLVMEYVDAPSLAAILVERKALAPTEIARIGAWIADALAAAHDAGIVHRDVKPANILVVRDDTAKITDFGISRAIGDITVTATGLVAGTPGYLAPEIARGEDPVPASDVFALGSTLYTAVEGRPLFADTGNPLALLHTVARAQVEPPRQAGVLGPVLMDLLAATPADRPTMRQAMAALEAVADGREPVVSATKVLPRSAPAASAPTTAVATTPVAAAAAPPAGRPKRSRILVAGLGSAGVLIVGGLVATVVTSIGTHDGSTTADAPTAVAAPMKSQAAPATGAAGTPLVTAPSGIPASGHVAAFIHGYYGQLPAGIAAAWSQLTPDYQAQTGGYAAYAAFWSGIRAVRVDAVTPRDDKTGVATLTYTRTDGSVDTEQRWVRVDFVDGQPRISGSGRN